MRTLKAFLRDGGALLVLALAIALWPSAVSAISASATSGFTATATCAGNPTGTPSLSNSDVSWTVWDSTNKRLKLWSGGAWQHPFGQDLTASASPGWATAAVGSTSASGLIRVYNSTDSLTSPTNAEWLEVIWATNLCTIETNATGTGSFRALTISCSGNLTLTATGGGIRMDYGGGYDVLWNSSGPQLPGSHGILWSSNGTHGVVGSFDTAISRPASGVLSLDTTTLGDALGKLKMAGTTAAGSLTPTWTNSPTALTGSRNPYTWLQFVATDGTAVYVPAFK